MIATPEMIAAAWASWHSRHGGRMGPGPGFVEAIEAAIAAAPKNGDGFSATKLCVACRKAALEDAAKIIDEMMLCGEGADVLIPRGNSGNKVGFGYAAAIRALAGGGTES